MSYLIDTNVLSELKKKQPDPNVVHWFSQRPASGLYISVLTVGEIRKGIERSIDGPRKQVLLDWLEFELPRFFVDRVLPVNTLVADQWGKLTGRISAPCACSRQSYRSHSTRT